MWLLIGLAAIAAGTIWGRASVDSIEIPGTESQRAFDLLEDRFPEAAGGRARVVFAVDAGEITDPTFRDGAEATLDQIRALPHVETVIDPFGPADGFLISDDGRIAFTEIAYSVSARAVGAEDVDALLATASPARAAGVEVAYGGPVVEQIVADGSYTSELIGLGVAVVVLAIAFGSISAMALPLVSSVFGILIGFALIRLLGAFIEVTSFAPIIASMVGIAVGIDYALFVVTRYRQHLAEGMPVDEAVARANATSGQAVIFAGMTVMVAILGLALIGIPLIAALGYAVSMVVAFAVLIAITLLPALLGLLGPRIDSLKVPGVRLRFESDHDASGALSARWARLVTRRPWPFLTASAALLIVLALPVFALQLGWPDAGNSRAGSPEREAFDLMAEGFGAGFNGPLLLAIDLADTPDPVGAVADVAGAIATTPGVVFVAPPQINDAGDTAIIQAIPASAPQDRQTTELIDTLRAEVAPPVEQMTGAIIEVTGNTAAFVDISKLLTARLPVFIGAVVVMSFLLLTVVFRSPVVALKAALMNLLGISAAYGVLVAVFQWGWGVQLIGLDEAIPIIAFLPMMMFAILFGISMDYEVFILSRVREDWLVTGDPIGSTVHGIAVSARVITAAALIMISVFGSFILGDLASIKVFGFGLAIAVALDATIIRMVVVPATMTLLGRHNWWMPRWLDRIIPNLDLEGAGALPSLPSPAVSTISEPGREPASADPT